MIGLISAMQVEMEQLLLALNHRRVHQVGAMNFYTGKLYGQEAVLAVCGPGKVNAALCAQAMILRFQPKWVLNLGVAGSIADGLTIGDMAAATGVVQHDMDTSPIGDPVGLISGINLVTLPCAPELLERITAAARALPQLRLFRGVIATGDQLIADAARKSWIADTFGAMCCEMEGAAVAHACYLHGVDCAVVRSISDQADGGAQMDYPKFVQLAAEHSALLVKKLLEGM